MVFIRITNKLALVQSVFNKPQRLAVERQIARSIEEMRGDLRISRASNEALQIDILYALARHARWVKVPLFRDVLVDFLVTDHELPRVGSEKLVNEILESCETLLGDDPNYSPADLLEGKVDEEFLTYIFVIAACSGHDSVVREQLGVGAGLLRSLKSAADSLAAREQFSRENSGGSDGPRLFLPDVDTVFATIMIKLTAAVRSCPWALDVYRLKYHLLEKLDRQRFACLSAHIPAVFEFLCAIGRENYLALPQETLASKWSAAHESGEISFEQVLQWLEHSGLIFRADVKKRGKRQVVFWDLTPVAEQITADAFVTVRSQSNSGELGVLSWVWEIHGADIAEQSKTPCAKPMKRMKQGSMVWRRGYLQHAIMKAPASDLIAASKESAGKLEDPLIVESIVSALVRTGVPDVAEHFFMSWSARELTQADAAALSRTGSALRSRPAVRSRLQTIAETHDSVALRSAALEGLL